MQALPLCLKSSGALEVRCKRVASLPQEIWSSGGVLRAWGRGGICLKRSGALWRRAAGVGTCRRHGGMEVWKCAAGV